MASGGEAKANGQMVEFPRFCRHLDKFDIESDMEVLYARPQEV